MDIKEENLTPAMKQYLVFKQKYPDAILMFRMGDFYEMFFDDAVTAAKELDIVLTSRGKGEKKAPLAGIPYHALEPYLAKLVKKNYKVAICEQVEDPKLAKGIVKREVVRVVTPGTVIEDSILEKENNNYIMSIYLNNDDTSIAVCDITTGELFVKDCKTDYLMNEVSRFNPVECLLPLSLTVNKDLVSRLEKLGLFITKFDDKHFSNERAKTVLLSQFKVASLDGYGLSKYAVNACGALLTYLKEAQLLDISHIKTIRNVNEANIMLLDSASMRNLELIQNIRDNSKKGTLLSVLDKTSTAIGARLLRKWIKEPLLDIEEIKKRLNAVETFVKKSLLRSDIQALLKNFADIERIAAKISYKTALPKDLLALKDSLKRCPLIKQALMNIVKVILTESEQNKLLDVYLFEDLTSVTSLVENAIKADANNIVRDGGVIKPEFDQELKELYDIKVKGKEFLKELELKERNATGIKNLKIGFNKVFGYFLEVSKSYVNNVPSHYIRKQTMANCERYITEELKAQEEKILNADEKIKIIENRIYNEVLEKISTKLDLLQDTASKIAVLDVLHAFAKVAIENNYVKPNIDTSDTIELVNSRHPVLEKLCKNFVPNDVKLSANNLMIITGPNMAGKSTVMRQVALNVLMAQIGSFVAASEARIGVVDKIFTRVGAYDDLTMGQSTFMVEMVEVANILNNATNKSLIILDEIGRGTSTFDGVSIAWAVAEHIYGKLKARTMFATHYHVLTKLAEQLEHAENFNIAVKENNGDIVFLHKLIKGATDRSYGVHVAKLAGVPAEVLARAAEIQQKLEEEDQMINRLNAKTHVQQKTLKELGVDI